MIKNMYEILAEISAKTTDEERQQVIRQNDSPAFRFLLRGAMHPEIRFVFDAPINYTPSDSPPGLGETSIYKEIWRVYLFERGNPRVAPNLTQERKSQLLVQMLEALEAKEAEVFMNMLLKDLKVPGLTRELVMSVYPDLI